MVVTSYGIDGYPSEIGIEELNSLSDPDLIYKVYRKGDPGCAEEPDGIGYFTTEPYDEFYIVISNLSFTEDKQFKVIGWSRP